METPRHSALLNLLEWLCRLVLAAVFLFAAYPKLLDPAAFAKAIDNYRIAFPIIGKGYIFFVASFLPAVELIAALGLLWNRTKRGAAWLAALSLIIFIILISQAVARGLNIDCGCFGTGATAKLMARSVGLRAVLEDVLWLAMAIFVYLRASRQAHRQRSRYTM
jgi:hypothetical protein